MKDRNRQYILDMRLCRAFDISPFMPTFLPARDPKVSKNLEMRKLGLRADKHASDQGVM